MMESCYVEGVIFILVCYQRFRKSFCYGSQRMIQTAVLSDCSFTYVVY